MPTTALAVLVFIAAVVVVAGFVVIAVLGLIATHGWDTEPDPTWPEQREALRRASRPRSVPK